MSQNTVNENEAARQGTTVPGGSFSFQAGSPNFSAIGPGVGSDTSAGKQKWCYKQTSVFSSIDPKFSALEAGRIVTIKQGGVNNVPGDNLGRSWSLIDENGNSGWVDELYLDDYGQESEYQVSIPNQTPNPYDAQQYMIWDGKAKFNMCGELCVAYVVEDDLEKVLNTWKSSESVQRYNNYAGMDKPTGIEDLKTILKAYGYNLDATAGDDIKNFTSIDVGQISDLLKTYLLIALVRIDKAKYGMLVPRQGSDPNQVDHWVVVNAIASQGTRVEIYNPFSNRMETYSYREFYKSVTGPGLSGSWVKRRNVSPPSAEAQAPLQAKTVNIVQGQQVKDPSRAAQYILVNGQEKHELCGEFSVAYILTVSINCARDYAKNGPGQATLQEAYGITSDAQQAGDGFSIYTVLGHWQKKQPNLYNYYVGQDHPTDRLDLKSILLEYGYSETDFELFPGSSLPSPGQIKEKLKDNFLIAGVGIDGSTGLLKKGADAVRHWEVLEDIQPVGRHYLTYYGGGNGGWVTLYNPFWNRLEEYSFREFTDTLGDASGMGWYGMWVKRNVNLNFVSHIVQPTPGTGAKAGAR